MNECVNDGYQEYMRCYRQILAKMIKGMTEVCETGSISYNFIIRMIPHHMAAIEMSENLLKYTKVDELREIAQNIISEQTKGIEDMRRIQSCCLSCRNPRQEVSEYECCLEGILKTMFSRMECAYTDRCISCDFIRQMIPHHMGAVEMSKNALKYPLCPQLKPILDSIITTQLEGIREMRELACRLDCVHM